MHLETLMLLPVFWLWPALSLESTPHCILHRSFKPPQLLTRKNSLTWGFLQERITTTDYNGSRFKYPVFLNTVQSFLAAMTGFVYLTVSTKHPHKPGRPLPIFPSRNIIYPLLLVALTSSLSSPFGYASLAHIDYITFILAKSCKLLPVILLHTTVFRRRYPLYKYLVVLAVTLGVAVFTLHHPAEASKASKHASKSTEGRNVTWGLLLLSINLLFDGLTNSTQDYIFRAFKPFTAPQMMCAMNVMSTSLTATYLIAAPYIAQTPIGPFLGMKGGDELSKALNFVQKYPSVGYDVVAFGIAGAVGQVAICKSTFHAITCLYPNSIQSTRLPISPHLSSLPLQ